MSEEEIRKVLLCENIGELAYCGLIDKLDESNNMDLNELKKQAIQGLLDLYEKEKEKNKRYLKYLENKDKHYESVLEYLESEKEQDYISKDKARGKIEEINNEKLNYSEDEYYLENEIKGYAIDKIKELLEE